MDQPTNIAAQSDSFPLTRRQQLRNVAIFALTNGLVYLAAPVVYVGITQASLITAMGYSDTVANLPTSAMFVAAVLPIIVAWRFHSVAAIKPVIITCYSISAVSGLAVAALLYLPSPNWLRLTAVLLHCGLIGASGSVLNPFQWEMISRGVAPQRRGLAFSLTFGIGPLFAVLGSLIAQWVLSGSLNIPWWSGSEGVTVRSLNFAPLQFPWNFAVLFAATGPILGLSALLTTMFVLPTVAEEPDGPTWASGLLQGGRELVADRVLLLALLAYVLIDCGSTINNNLSLYTRVALDQPAEAYVGYQNALRFSFKVIAGLFLGWLLSRTNAKLGMLATGGMILCGILWVLLMPHAWYLACFGLMGAGELYGVYYPNYIMNCSRPHRVRHNMALLPLLGLVTGLTPIMFGAISDGFGLPASFMVATVVVGTSLTVIALGLPARPKPLWDNSTEPKPDAGSGRRKSLSL